jgi:stage V sporulation protein G
MKITKVSITAGEWGKTKAMVTVEFDKCFVVGGLKIIEGASGYFVSMPNRKLADGTYKDTCFPITKEFREELIKTILNKFSEKGIEEDDNSDSSSDFPF